MKKHTTRTKNQNLDLFVGLDVHKQTIDVATADEGRDSEVRHYGQISGDLDALDRVIRKLQSTGRTLHVVYEAGPCGARYLPTPLDKEHRLHCDRAFDDPKEERRPGQDQPARCHLTGSPASRR